METVVLFIKTNFAGIMFQKLVITTLPIFGFFQNLGFMKLNYSKLTVSFIAEVFSLEGLV